METDSISEDQVMKFPHEMIFTRKIIHVIVFIDLTVAIFIDFTLNFFLREVGRVGRRLRAQLGANSGGGGGDSGSETGSGSGEEGSEEGSHETGVSFYAILHFDRFCVLIGTTRCLARVHVSTRKARHGQCERSCKKKVSFFLSCRNFLAIKLTTQHDIYQ